MNNLKKYFEKISPELLNIVNYIINLDKPHVYVITFHKTIDRLKIKDIVMNFDFENWTADLITDQIESIGILGSVHRHKFLKCEDIGETFFLTEEEAKKKLEEKE